MKKRKTAGHLAMKNSLLFAVLVTGLLITGCGRQTVEQEGDSTATENIVITETGEIIEKPTPAPTSIAAQTPAPAATGQNETPTPMAVTPIVSQQEAPTPVIDVDIPVQEQVITQEDQTEPRGHALQLVFLGDSIFDNNRDGTGVPFLTAEKCDADFYNLAIGGTSASIEIDEQQESELWTSRGLCGIVNALLKKIPTDIFAGTRTGELLNNPQIDYSQTDYFIVEYGTNDFFRGVRQSDPDNIFNMRTYRGALTYAATNLTNVAPDATVIFCSPMYAQFFKDGYLIGDGNITNNGNGTLFDYVGTCNYVAKENNALFLNAYQDLGIDGYTAEEYLEDGVHLTQAGRELYAEELSKIILNYEETKNN